MCHLRGPPPLLTSTQFRTQSPKTRGEPPCVENRNTVTRVESSRRLLIYRPRFYCAMCGPRARQLLIYRTRFEWAMYRPRFPSRHDIPARFTVSSPFHAANKKWPVHVPTSEILSQQLRNRCKNAKINTENQIRLHHGRLQVIVRMNVFVFHGLPNFGCISDHFVWRPAINPRQGAKAECLDADTETDAVPPSDRLGMSI